MVSLINWMEIKEDIAERVARLGCGLREGTTDEFDYETFLRIVEDAYGVCESDLEVVLDEIGEW